MKKNIIYYSLLKNIKTIVIEGNTTHKVVFEKMTTTSDTVLESPLHDSSNIRKHYRSVLDILGSCNGSCFKESMNAKGIFIAQCNITEILWQLVQFHRGYCLFSF